LAAEAYRLALRHAEAARDLAHPGYHFRLADAYHPATYIAIAHYRLGEYREAPQAPASSHAHYAGSPFRYTSGTPRNLAFRAMAHHQLGEQQTAQADLDRLHRLMKEPRWSDGGDHRSYVQEAEELLGAGTPDRSK